MTTDLIGAKCHLCEHLLGSTHNTATLLGNGPCSDCAFCDHDNVRAALGAFTGDFMEIQNVLRDLWDGRANPLLDKLCAEVEDVTSETDAVQDGSHNDH